MDGIEQEIEASLFHHVAAGADRAPPVLGEERGATRVSSVLIRGSVEMRTFWSTDQNAHARPPFPRYDLGPRKMHCFLTYYRIRSFFYIPCQTRQAVLFASRARNARRRFWEQLSSGTESPCPCSSGLQSTTFLPYGSPYTPISLLGARAIASCKSIARFSSIYSSLSTNSAKK